MENYGTVGKKKVQHSFQAEKRCYSQGCILLATERSNTVPVEKNI